MADKDVSHADLQADIRVLQSEMKGVKERVADNGRSAKEASQKIDALTNQLKGANFLFAGALALGGVIIGWLASLGLVHR